MIFKSTSTRTKIILLGTLLLILFLLHSYQYTQDYGSWLNREVETQQHMNGLEAKAKADVPRHVSPIDVGAVENVPEVVERTLDVENDDLMPPEDPHYASEVTTPFHDPNPGYDAMAATRFYAETDESRRANAEYSRLVSLPCSVDSPSHGPTCVQPSSIQGVGMDVVKFVSVNHTTIIVDCSKPYRVNADNTRGEDLHYVEPCGVDMFDRYWIRLHDKQAINLKRETRYFFRAVAVNALTGDPIFSAITSVRTAVVAVATVMYDEEATIPLAVASWGKADKIILVDTGSQDQTVPLVRSLYSKEIRLGKIVFKSLPRRLIPAYDMGTYRKHLLELLRINDVDFLLKFEADDIIANDAIAEQLFLRVKQLPELGMLTLNSMELKQFTYKETRPWLDAILRKDAAFYQCFTFQNQRLQIVYGTSAAGRWSDEAAFNRPEGYTRTLPINGVYTFAPLASYHYGWARPNNKIREKLKAFGGNGEYVMGDQDKQKCTVFKDHPEKVMEAAKRAQAYFNALT